MSIKDNRSLLNSYITSELGNIFGKRQNTGGGLLNFVKSPYAGDIGMGLLAQSGYSTMPTSFGQSLGIATNQANELRRQRNADQIAKLATASQLSETLKPSITQVDPTKDMYIDNKLIRKGVTASKDPNSYKEYLRTDDTPTNEEYLKFLDRNQTAPKAEVPRPYQDPNGETLTITDTEFNKLDPEYRKTLIPFEATKDMLEGSDKALTNFKDKISNFEQTGVLTEKLINDLNNSNTLTASFPKATVAIIDSIRQNITQSIEIFADDKMQEKITDTALVSKNKSLIDDVVKATGIADSLLITLAYQKALVSNPDGRISDKDFKFAMESLKGLSSNKESLIAILEDNMDTINQFALVEFNNAKRYNALPEDAIFEDFYNKFEISTSNPIISQPSNDDPLGLL
tara:strand:+ start:2557 stop:3759 length:1203 start_codon:yes stop_codon:yes gene_type:complete